MKITQSIYQISFLVVLFAVFTSYNFMFADAPANPPANNVAAPITVSATPQAKAGGLDLAALTVQGGSIFSGTLAIKNTAPQIEFDDTSGDNNKWWLHSNAYGSGPRMHFLYDRNNNGTWDAGDGNASVFVQAGAAVDGSQDILQANGQVRAREYCDLNGGNCFPASEVGGSGNVGVPFGGMYTRTVNNSDKKAQYQTINCSPNPATNACTCAAGTSPYVLNSSVAQRYGPENSGGNLIGEDTTTRYICYGTN